MITVLALVVLFIVIKPVYARFVDAQYFKTHTDETLTEWLTEHYQEVLDGQKDYTFDLKIETMSQDPYYNDPDSDIRFPAFVEEHYTVTVLQNEKLVKFEKTYTDRYYHGLDEPNTFTETYDEMPYYFEIKNDTVSYYYPENGTYAVKTVKDAEVAQAFDALLFPENLNFLEKINENQGVKRSLGGYTELEVTREIDMSVLYEPFRLIRGDDKIPSELPVVQFNVFTDKDPEMSGLFQINFIQADEYIDYVYFTIHNKMPENPLGDETHIDAKNLWMTFYPDQFDVEKFELPNIE